MDVGLPREIFINDKPERFALNALVYWDAIYINVHCVVIKDCSFCLELTTINSVLATLRLNLLALSQHKLAHQGKLTDTTLSLSFKGISNIL